MKLIVDCWRSAPSAGRRKLGGFEQYPDRNGDTCPERDADECREQTAAVETDSRIVTNGSDVGDSAVALGLAHLRNCVRIGDDSKFPSGEPPYPFEVLRLRRVSQGLRLPSCDFGTACEVNLPRTPFRSGARKTSSSSLDYSLVEAIHASASVPAQDVLEFWINHLRSFQEQRLALWSCLCIGRHQQRFVA